MKANSNKLIRKANKYLILNIIRQLHNVTLDMVQAHTKLSYPTVNKLVNELLDSGIIMKNGFADSNGGKPAALLSLNINKYFALGIDVEIPAIRFAVSDLYGNILYQCKADLKEPFDDQTVLSEIFKGIEKCAAESGKELSEFVGIGIGLPGTIDLVNNVSVAVERIRGWRNVDLIGIIQEKYKIPAYIRNDVHLMALLENMLMEDEQTGFAMVAIRQGIGMAIILGGNAYEGIYGNAGFIGHTTVILDGEPCKCGKRGCLEVYSGREAIVNSYKRKAKSEKELQLADIIALADEGDEIAAGVLKNAGKYLGITIANNIKILDLKTFVISGLPEAEKDIFFKTIVETVNEHIIFAHAGEIKVIKSQYDNESYALGGCFFVIEQFFKKPNLKLQV